MARHLRQQTANLGSQLFEKPFQFEFHQAVKLIEMQAPECKSLGEGTRPEEEALILKGRILYSYPASDLYSAKTETSHDSLISGKRITVHVNFFGIAGAHGPLPSPYTEVLYDRIRHQDTAGRDFLDIFNHRLLSILHRIRKKHWIGLSEQNPDKTPFADNLYALLGLGIKGTRNRLGIPDRGLLYYTGLLWGQPRSMVGLKTFLSNYFDLPVEVIQFQGGWNKLEASQVTRIGVCGRFNLLGQGAALGEKVWNQRKNITIRLGPLDGESFLAFIKPGYGYTPLYDLTKFYVGVEQEFQFNLVIKASDAMETRLDGKTYLGWTSWLKTKPFTEDDGQVYLRP
ncbi:hypothetical protein IM40_01700 [Candidatus Paracaedimonas acanthamoebae]|nr:hypothetical protein IM40_01700 [Candidatus Paracaedimonas acanthamoebae]